MNARVFNVLFVCTGNSARSIMAEAILNRIGKGRFRAFSAGLDPAGQVNPFALEALRDQGVDTSALRSKDWQEFAGSDAPVLDFVFTLATEAAEAERPDWRGNPVVADWAMADPAAGVVETAARRRAMMLAFQLLWRRTSLFASLPLSKLDAMSLQRQVDTIGRAPVPPDAA